MNNKFIFKFPNKVNLKNYRHSSSNNAVFYGLNKKVEFCTKCTYSNQKPNSEKEFTHTLKTIKPTVKLKKKMSVMLVMFMITKKIQSIGKKEKNYY